MSTESPTRDQMALGEALDALTEVVRLLTAVAEDMTALAGEGTRVRCAPGIALFARSAADSTDIALMIARNEGKLAERGL